MLSCLCWWPLIVHIHATITPALLMENSWSCSFLLFHLSFVLDKAITAARWWQKSFWNILTLLSVTYQKYAHVKDAILKALLPLFLVNLFLIPMRDCGVENKECITLWKAVSSIPTWWQLSTEIQCCLECERIEFPLEKNLLMGSANYPRNLLGSGSDSVWLTKQSRLTVLLSRQQMLSWQTPC